MVRLCLCLVLQPALILHFIIAFCHLKVSKNLVWAITFKIAHLLFNLKYQSLVHLLLTGFTGISFVYKGNGKQAIF